LDWRLLIDNNDIIGGAITTPVTIPGRGSGNYNSNSNLSRSSLSFLEAIIKNLIDLALAIGGKTGNKRETYIKDPSDCKHIPWGYYLPGRNKCDRTKSSDKYLVLF
jgi:hypothetical protein